jgi:capsule biosynthesis phosphatase
MRICIDLDGVICALRAPDQSYADVEPVPGAADAIRALRASGHHVIIQTARHMKTCNGNVAAVIARVGPVTLSWLERHGIEYDEIQFGKPYADVYIDDNALRFESWSAIGNNGRGLPMSAEARAQQARERPA